MMNLGNLIAQESYSYEGQRRKLKLVEDLLGPKDEHNCVIKKVDVGDGLYNLIAFKGTLVDPRFTIFIPAHIDTVRPAKRWHDWNLLQASSRNPDRLRGLGVGDMQAAVLNNINLSRTLSVPEGMLVIFCWTVDEEDGSRGAQTLTGGSRPGMPVDWWGKVDLVLSSEIGALSIEENDPVRYYINERDGIVKTEGVINVQEQGSGHAAEHDKGNASDEVEKAIALARESFNKGEWYQGKEYDDIRRISSKFIGAENFKVWYIDAPKTKGAVHRQDARFGIKVEIVYPNRIDLVVAAQKKCFEKISAYLKWSKNNIEYTLAQSKDTSYAPFSMAQDHPLVQAVHRGLRQQSGHEPIGLRVSPWSDENLYAASGKPVISIPYRTEGAHSPREWASRRDIARVREALRFLITQTLRDHMMENQVLSKGDEAVGIPGVPRLQRIGTGLEEIQTGIKKTDPTTLKVAFDDSPLEQAELYDRLPAHIARAVNAVGWGVAQLILDRLAKQWGVPHQSVAPRLGFPSAEVMCEQVAEHVAAPLFHTYDPDRPELFTTIQPDELLERARMRLSADVSVTGDTLTAEEFAIVYGDGATEIIQGVIEESIRFFQEQLQFQNDEAFAREIGFQSLYDLRAIVGQEVLEEMRYEVNFKNLGAVDFDVRTVKHTVVNSLNHRFGRRRLEQTKSERLGLMLPATAREAYSAVHPRGQNNDRARELLMQANKRRARMLELYVWDQQGAHLEFQEAKQLSARVLPGAEPLTSAAPRLAHRHNGLHRAVPIAQAILAAHSGDRVPLASVRQITKKNGAFLMIYDEAVIHHRLSHPEEWVVAEASAEQMYRDRPHFGEVVTAGDCQCQLPLDRPDAPFVVQLPAEDDPVYQGENVIRDIQECPAVAGIVADICVEDAMTGLRVAGAARKEAFRRVEELNAEREIPIRYMLAEIFSIRGIRLPDGTEVLLEDLQETTVDNFASFFMHHHSKQYPAMGGWKLRNKNVPVLLPGGDPEHPHELITDWLVMIHTLSKR